MGVLTLVPVAVTCESHLDHHPLTVGLTIFLVLLLSDGVDDAELLAVLGDVLLPPAGEQVLVELDLVRQRLFAEN